jgi:phospholipid transport system substrate-binding protein
MAFRRWLAGTVVAMTLLGFVPGPAAAGSATERVRDFFASVNRVITDPEDRAPEERLGALRALVTQMIEFRTAARTALGSEWVARTPAQRDEFVTLFADLLQTSVFGAVGGRARIDNGITVSYVGELADQDGVTVATRILARSANEIAVRYRMALREGRWMVHDVVIDGVSLVDNYRAQFQKVIQRSSYAGLVGEMRARLVELGRGTTLASAPGTSPQVASIGPAPSPSPDPIVPVPSTNGGHEPAPPLTADPGRVEPAPVVVAAAVPSTVAAAVDAPRHAAVPHANRLVDRARIPDPPHAADSSRLANPPQATGFPRLADPPRLADTPRAADQPPPAGASRLAAQPPAVELSRPAETARPAATPPPPVTPTNGRPSAARPREEPAYWVQVGAFRTDDAAIKAASALRDDAISLLQMPDTPLLRVLVGPFASRQAAASKLRDLRARGIDGFVAELTP